MTNNTDETTAAIWYKGKRVIRTIFQGVVGAVPIVVAVLGVIASQWNSEWVLAALATSVAIQGVLAKIMANEIVNAWLIKHTFLGSEPKNASISYE